MGLQDKTRCGRYAKIIGTGSFLPPNKYTTADLKRFFPQIDLEANLKNIGVKTRFFVRKFETGEVSHTNSQLTAEAAKIAIKDADLDIGKLDLIVTTTASPDYSIPNMACQVQELVGADNAVATGILSGCGGFTHALTIAAQFIENGQADIALVTGSEVLSPYLDFSHPECIKTQVENSTIFGDGAGAVVLRAAQDDDRAIISNFIGSEGKKNPLFLHDSGSKNRPSEESIKQGKHFWDLDLKLIVALTPKFMMKAAKEVLADSGIELSMVDWIIPHQPAMPLVKHFAKRLNFPYEKMIVHLEDIGDTADACLPISLDLAAKANKLKKGDLVLLVAAGAGWMYGANLIKW